MKKFLFILYFGLFLYALTKLWITSGSPFWGFIIFILLIPIFIALFVLGKFSLDYIYVKYPNSRGTKVLKGIGSIAYAITMCIGIPFVLMSFICGDRNIMSSLGNAINNYATKSAASKKYPKNS
ncbi:MAG: hypothetical protein LBS53_04075 [Synergistaceae bacterium]|jgi:hypothetical protein|nr:hypothetical protein [Synergistaceae bacterium]